MKRNQVNTPEQAAEYLSRLSGRPIKNLPGQQKRKKKRPKKPNNRGKAPGSIRALQEHQEITVLLRASHCVNGVMYGPGKVRVLRPLGEALIEAEQRAINYDNNWQAERAAVIGPAPSAGGAFKATKVAPQFFEASHPLVGEAAVATGSEASSLGAVTTKEGQLAAYKWQEPGT